LPGADNPASRHTTRSQQDMKDAEHPFFRPLWRRIAIVAFCAVWAAWEYANGQAMWATIAGGMALYGGWVFLLTYKAPAEPGSGQATPDKKEP
jgi:hypothetical protein